MTDRGWADKPSQTTTKPVKRPEKQLASGRIFIDPLSPLVFRNGQTLGDAGQLGAIAVHPFPLPGTIAGAIRGAILSRLGISDQELGHGPRRQQFLQGINVTGPFLAKVPVGAPIGHASIFLPPPADCVFKNGGAQRLMPQLVAEGSGCDLPNELTPLFLPDDGSKSKPDKGPDWWSLDEYCDWMLDVKQDFSMEPRGAVLDVRTHVVLDENTKLATDGGLYATGGLDFGGTLGKESASNGLVAWISMLEKVHDSAGGGERRHEVFRPQEPFSISGLDNYFGKIGADGRGARFHASDEAGDLPSRMIVPDSRFEALHNELKRTNVGDVIRLALVTPAFFRYNGWFPDGLQASEPPELPKHKRTQGNLRGALPSLPDWEFTLVAAALNRWEPYAGAAMAGSAKSEVKLSGRGRYGKERKEGIPMDRMSKPLRRLVPAGATYWLKVEKKGAGTIADALLKSVCYEEYARDGFGIAMFGSAGDKG